MSPRSLRAGLLSHKVNPMRWATISAVTGSPTTGTYTDADGVKWKYYQWSVAGTYSVTTTAGVVDALVIGGGHQTNGAAPSQGIVSVTAGAQEVVVGPLRSGAGEDTHPSWFGDLTSEGAENAAYFAVRQQGGRSAAPRTYYITGTGIKYGYDAGPGYGAAGAVIIRVPIAYALA